MIKTDEDHAARDCGGSVVLTEETEDPRTGEINTSKREVACGRKSCPTCGPRLRSQFIAHYHDELGDWLGEERTQVWFAVLTLKEKLRGPFAQRLKALKQNVWVPYRRQLNYHAGELSYIWTVETGDRDRIHLNLLTRTDLGPSELEERWHQCRGGFENYAQEVDTHQDLLGVLSYMAKEQFADPNRGEDGFPGHRTNGHSNDVTGYTSEEARKKQREYAREQALETLLDSSSDETVVCDEEVLDQYLAEVLPDSIGQEVQCPDGRRGRLVAWDEEEGARVWTGTRLRRYDAREVLPIGAPLPELHVETQREPRRWAANSTPQKPIGTFAPTPEVRPDESIFVASPASGAPWASRKTYDAAESDAKVQDPRSDQRSSAGTFVNSITLQPNADRITDITVVLDSSGSMSSIKNSTIEGFNDFLEDQRQEDGDAQITLYQFDTSVEEVWTERPLSEANKLSDANYAPGGSTALYDAIGRAISEAKSRRALSARDVQTLYVIVTDGEENSSEELSHEEINDLIEEEREEGFEFIFLAANQNAMETAGSMGIDPGKSLTYAHNDEGTQQAYASTSSLASEIRSGNVAASYDAKDRAAQQQAAGGDLPGDDENSTQLDITESDGSDIEVRTSDQLAPGTAAVVQDGSVVGTIDYDHTDPTGQTFAQEDDLSGDNGEAAIRLTELEALGPEDRQDALSVVAKAAAGDLPESEYKARIREVDPSLLPDA